MLEDPENWREVAEELARALLHGNNRDCGLRPGEEWWREAARLVAVVHSDHTDGVELSREALRLVNEVAGDQGTVEEEQYRRGREGKCEAGEPMCPRHAKAQTSGGRGWWCPEPRCGWRADDWGSDCPMEAVAEVTDATGSLTVCGMHLMAIRRSPIPHLKVRPLKTGPK